MHIIIRARAPDARILERARVCLPHEHGRAVGQLEQVVVKQHCIVIAKVRVTRRASLCKGGGSGASEHVSRVSLTGKGDIGWRWQRERN